MMDKSCRIRLLFWSIKPKIAMRLLVWIQRQFDSLYTRLLSSTMGLWASLFLPFTMPPHGMFLTVLPQKHLIQKVLVLKWDAWLELNSTIKPSFFSERILGKQSDRSPHPSILSFLICGFVHDPNGMEESTCKINLRKMPSGGKVNGSAWHGEINLRDALRRKSQWLRH